MRSARNSALVLTVAALVTLSACATPTESPIALPTPDVTVIAPSTPLPQPSDTPLPAVVASPTELASTPEPSPTEPCANDATFLDDLTVPDDTVFLPGDSIDKRWSVQNTGTCDWNGEYRLVNTNEETLGAPSEIALFPARSGSVAALQVLMTAPQTPGDYVSRWQARSPEGNLFGASVFIKIHVPEPTATP